MFMMHPKSRGELNGRVKGLKQKKEKHGSNSYYHVSKSTRPIRGSATRYILGVLSTVLLRLSLRLD